MPIAVAVHVGCFKGDSIARSFTSAAADCISDGVFAETPFVAEEVLATHDGGRWNVYEEAGRSEGGRRDGKARS